MTFPLKTLFIALSLSSLASAMAAEPKPAMSKKHAEAYTEYRQSVFQLIKSNMAPLGGMAKGAIAYDPQVMQTNGMRLEQLAAMLTDYLQVDTSKFDVSTEARPVIWEQFDDVQSKIADLKTAAVNLQSAAQTGDESQYKKAIGKVGASCKSCHDDYKE